MELLVNQILQHNSNFFRVLYFNVKLDICVLINLSEEQNQLEHLDIDSLTKHNYTNPTNPPSNFNTTILNEVILELKEKTLERWEKSWEQIKDLVTDEPNIFETSYLNKKCKAVSEQYNVSRHTVKRNIFNYWRNGKTKYAILPKYYLSGGKGKERQLEQNNAFTITDKIKEEIQAAYKANRPEGKDGTLRGAYINYIRLKYKKEFDNKETKKYPSLTQFYYWGTKNLSSSDKLAIKKGVLSRDKDHRLVPGSSYNSVFGPGIFQIDSTPSDVEIISEIDLSEPIGCPTVYFVADIFSGLCTGIYVTLENPSYHEASTALYYSFKGFSMFANDMLLGTLNKFNVDATSAFYPSTFLPHQIVTDNGKELVSRNSNNIITDLGIDIENKEAYRADLKGLVENFFKIYHKDLKCFPKEIGHKNMAEGRRGIKKARKNATYTLKQYTAMIAVAMANYNHKCSLKKYPLAPEMIKDGLVDPSPIEVWNWGMKNRTGLLRSSEISNLKELMLPRAVGKLNKHDLEFEKIKYETPLHKDLRNIQQQTGEVKLKYDISYNPNNMNTINLFFNNEIIKCSINEQKNPGLINKSLKEIRAFNKVRKNVKKEKEHDRDSGTMDILDMADSFKKENDKKRKSKGQKSTSKAKVSYNREREKEHDRKQKEFKSTEEPNSDTKVIDINTSRENKRIEGDIGDILDDIYKNMDNE